MLFLAIDTTLDGEDVTECTLGTDEKRPIQTSWPKNTDEFREKVMKTMEKIGEPVNGFRYVLLPLEGNIPEIPHLINEFNEKMRKKGKPSPLGDI